jgi:hypothetical protein
VPLCGRIDVGGAAGVGTAARKRNTTLRGRFAPHLHCWVTVVEPWTTKLYCAREKPASRVSTHLGPFLNGLAQGSIILVQTQYGPIQIQALMDGEKNL